MHTFILNELLELQITIYNMCVCVEIIPFMQVHE